MLDNSLQVDLNPKGLNKLRIKILFEQTIVAQISGLVVAGIYVFLFREKVSFDFLSVWTLFLFLITAARFALVRYFTHYHVTLNRDFDANKYENIFIGLTACAGINWGIASCFGVAQPDLISDSLMGFILAGITAGAAVAYSASLKSIYAFFIPAVIPFAFKMALVKEETHIGMAGMLFAYTVVFLNLTHKFNQYAVRSISLGFEKEQLIDRIRSMQAKAMQSAQMIALGEMSRGMAHEINNPLAIIKVACSHLDNLTNTSLPEEPKSKLTKYLHSIDKSSDRIAKIIRDLQAFAGKIEDETFDTVKVRKLIERATEFCGERYRNNNIRFTVEESNPDLEIECRSTQITQVILNLLNNSFDAVCKNEEKWVRLEIIDRIEKVEIAVVDSGRGIPEEVRSRIMKPFFTTKEIGKGIGLGLSFCKGVVTDHKGEIGIDAAYPNTRFVVTLPKVRPVQNKVA